MSSDEDEDDGDNARDGDESWSEDGAAMAGRTAGGGAGDFGGAAGR
jgi:hypothetical protein